MGRSAFRRMVSCVLMLAFPVSLFAADSSTAMLYAHGAAWINGSHVPASSAIFTGDLLQTRFDSGANINAPGSAITVLGDSLVEFEGSALKVERGAVAVATSTRIAATAGDVQVAPASSTWTEYNLSDVDGTVRIIATKGDLIVSDDNGSVTLPQGQQTTRDAQPDQSAKTDASDNKSGKKKNKKQDGAAPGATGGLLNSTAAIAVGLGAAAGAGLAIWAITGSGENPVSPSTIK